MLRWGICCCGNISHDFTSAIFEYQDARIKLVAVAGRSLEKASEFAKKYKMKYGFGSYEELANCDEIDVVYVAVINSQHFPLVRLFLEAGKHVLVEKPMGISVVEATEMIDLARHKRLFLMEGIWSRFFPVYKKVKEISENGCIGQLKHINANFQYHLGTRVGETKLPFNGSGMWTIGFYGVQLALYVFPDAKLTDQKAIIKRHDNGLDWCGQIFLEFDHDKTAFISYNVTKMGDFSASLYGEKGNIVLPIFWSPEDFVMDGKMETGFRTARMNEEIKYNFFNSWGFIHEVRHVTDCILQGRVESDIVPHSESLKIANILENLLVNN